MFNKLFKYSKSLSSILILNKIKFTNYSKYFKPELDKIIISSMKNTENTTRLVSEKDSQELHKLITELNIHDKNMPDVPKKITRVTSFGGRIRIAGLLSPDAEKWIGKTVTIGGWAKTLRLADGGELCFIELNDGSTINNAQIVVNKNIENFQEILKEGIGTCFQIRGEVVVSPGSKQAVNIYIK